MAIPSTIDEFCLQHGLSAYLPMMRENEVDLDVVRDLSTKDWVEMGMEARDVPRLVAATRTLPPGSFRFWGKGQNPVTTAVKKAMAEKPLPAKLAEKSADARPAPVARFGAGTKKNTTEKKVFPCVWLRTAVTCALHAILAAS